jgi:hypothetical protein
MARTYGPGRTDLRLCPMYQTADNGAQEEKMDNPDRTPGPDPLDSHDEDRLSGLTGMTADAAKTFLDFHTGMRWLRHRDPPES